MRDIMADWRRWSVAERIAAILLLMALAAAVPMLANAGALAH
jgi:hypothetical protein